MNHCRECHATMTKTETVCISCGSALEQDTGHDKVGRSLMFVVTIILGLSCAMTIASLFVDGLHFTRCAPATLVLTIVRSSAQEMLVKKKGS
jgi:hypothetical protein